jgi:hypothetical protein
MIATQPNLFDISLVLTNDDESNDENDYTYLVL